MPTDPPAHPSDVPPEVDWDARFDRDEYVFGTRPNSFLEEHAEVIPAGGRVLAIADGEGRNSVWLAERGYTVDALDGSAIAVAKARRLAAVRGVTVDHRHEDLTRMEWPRERYDAVVAIFIQFLPGGSRRALWAHVHRTLRPGGHLLLIGYTQKQLVYRTGGPGDPDRLYEPGRLRGELDAFSLERFATLEYAMDEGPGHRGMSAVVEVIARR